MIKEIFDYKGSKISFVVVLALQKLRLRDSLETQ